MAEFKLTIADPKTGKCVQKTIEADTAKNLMGLKIGDTVKGEVMDLTGYEFEITGGSDYCGFPMRKGIQGARKRVLIGPGVGFKGGKKGIRKRKTVCGESINETITQINLKITKKGKADLTAGKAEGESPKEEAKAEAPKEEAKPEAKEAKPAAEAKPAEKKAEEAKEEKPQEETKPEEKKEEAPKKEEKKE
ncbi:MAG: 30S ribosomal protein S6e [Candidatus Woesearchaeota archaeon]